MKTMARTKEQSYLNNYKGEPWQEVVECFNNYASGPRQCVRFADGFVCKVERCEICYVFEK